MIKTYEDFISEADKAGLTSRFTEQDLLVAQKSPEYGYSLMRLMQDGSKAQTPEQQLIATEAANQLRKNYGVYTGSGGVYASSNGSKIAGLTDKLDNYGTFSYDKQDDYQKALQDVAAQQPFSYDKESDPAWDAYKKTYLREGDRASANVLAQISARTGGIPSSYAVTAAQQAGNYYASQLADIIPTLQQNAYSRYLNEIASKYDILDALQEDRSVKYNDWLKQYEMIQDSLLNAQSQDATDYQRYLTSQAGSGDNVKDSTGTVVNENDDTAPTGNTGDLSAVPEDTVTAYKSLYPGGVITDQASWNFLVTLYGEEALRAAGLTYGSNGTVPYRGAVVDETQGSGTGVSLRGGLGSSPLNRIQGLR